MGEEGVPQVMVFDCFRLDTHTKYSSSHEWHPLLTVGRGFRLGTRTNTKPITATASATDLRVVLPQLALLLPADFSFSAARSVSTLSKS